MSSAYFWTLETESYNTHILTVRVWLLHFTLLYDSSVLLHGVLQNSFLVHVIHLHSTLKERP